MRPPCLDVVVLVGLLMLLNTIVCLENHSPSLSSTESFYIQSVRNDTIMTEPWQLNWNELEVGVVNHTAHSILLKSILPMPGTVRSDYFVPQPVYISLTTMASRMDSIDETITNLLQARIVPTMIYLFISEEPYLMDTGVKVIPLDLLCFVAAGYLRIIYTQNIGPHRKLLPALKRHWGEDVFIVTMDDDMEIDQSHVILYQILKYYVKGGGGNRMVSLRARRIGICGQKPFKTTPYNSWTVNNNYGRKEMLVLPTGNGGVLYKPTFFHPIIFNKAFIRVTMTADDVTFRVATMINRIPVMLGCIPLRYKGRVARDCEYDEFDKKYDEQFGTASTKYYYKVVPEVTKKLVLENDQKIIAAALALEALRSENTTTRDIAEKVAEQSTFERRLTENFMQDQKQLSLPLNTSSENKRTYSDTRRVLFKFPTRRIPKSMNSSDLFSYNKMGGNDHAWKSALLLVKTMHLFDFWKFAGRKLDERENYCMNENLPYRTEHNCAIYVC